MVFIPFTGIYSVIQKRNEHPHPHISHHRDSILVRMSRTLYSYHLFHATLWKWKERVVADVSTIIGDMLQRVCVEMDYTTDVWRVTRGGEY